MIKATGSIRPMLFLKLICLVIMLNVTALITHGATEMEIVTITKDICADTTWEGGKIYRISGIRTVHEGAVLTIQPGAVIKFVNNGLLYINGEICAKGTEENYIYFTVGNDSSLEVGPAVEGTPRWLGISIRENGKAALEYVEIRYAEEKGILVESDSAYLEARHCVFFNNKIGVNIGKGTGRIENSVFQSNEEGIKIFGLSGGEAFIKNNHFFLGATAANKTGINIASLNKPVEILENIFSGTDQATNTVGIRIYPSEDPQNRLLNIMFNTFRKIGTGVKIEGGGHRLRGNNFFDSRMYAVYFDLRPQTITDDLKADIKYNFWNSSDGPRLAGYSNAGSGDYISHPDYLNFEPWGTRSYEPCYEPLEVSIISPQNGEYLLGSVDLKASSEDANLKELIFYIDGEEVFRVEEDEIAGGEAYCCEWSPAGGEESLKESYLFSVKAVNQLGEENERSLTFYYLKEAPPPPQVSILTPLEGSHINEDILIEVQAEAAVEPAGAEGLKSLVLEIDGVKVAETLPPQTTLTWRWETAAYSEGFFTIRAKAEDIFGQESSAEVIVCLDRTPPRGTLSINEGALYTSDPTLQLKINAEDNFSIAGMKLSASLDFTQVDWGPFLPSLTWTLGGEEEAAVDGKHYLYLLLKDKAGNVSPVIQASITLVTNSPPSPYGSDSDEVEAIPAQQNENCGSEKEVMCDEQKEQEETPGEKTLPEYTDAEYADITKIFGDIEPGHPVADAIFSLYSRGIIKGMKEGVFAPEEPLNRAQAAALLLKLPLDFSKKNFSSPGAFKDLEAEAWYTSTVKTAADIGLMNGYKDGTFRPSSPINGAEFAVLLCRLERFVSKTVTPTVSPVYADTTFIEPVRSNNILEKTPLWAYSSVKALLKKGIIGNEELLWFDPRQHLSRAEAAILLWKTCIFYRI